MDNYWMIILIPISWWALSISYQIVKLTRLWLKYKLQNLKELKIWD